MDDRTALEVLEDAKLSGTIIRVLGDGDWTYHFRSNEQAAERAIRALKAAGWRIVQAPNGLGTGPTMPGFKET